METKVDAYIARDPNGIFRVMVKRAKYKHWFQLGRHAATDAAFEQAWPPEPSVGNRKLLTRANFFEKNLWKLKKYPYICTRNVDGSDGPGRFPVKS